MTTASPISLANFTITISNINFDSMNAFATFDVMSILKNLKISINSNIPLAEIKNMSQTEIINKLWDRAYASATNWFVLVNRGDVNLASLVGSQYVPA